jgi:hypothetical protein
MIDTVCIHGDLAKLSTKSQSDYFVFPVAFAPRSRLDLKPHDVAHFCTERENPHARLRFRIIVFNEVVSL